MSPNPPPYNAEFKNGWSYVSIRLIELLDVDRDKFNFPSYVIKSVLQSLGLQLASWSTVLQNQQSSVDQHITSFLWCCSFITAFGRALSHINPVHTLVCQNHSNIYTLFPKGATIRIFRPKFFSMLEACPVRLTFFSSGFPRFRYYVEKLSEENGISL